MKNSNVISIQEYRISRNYYNIGLIIGALRAELENGAVEIESVYSLLTDDVKSAIGSDLAHAGGVR
ncbi:MAG: hypothetical protein NC293_07730 [Roseburia sp.]|nr:hypothetical protein [Roseburia sp.]